MQEDNNKSTVRGIHNVLRGTGDSHLGDGETTAAVCTGTPALRTQRRASQVEYVDYTENLVSPAEDSVPFQECRRVSPCIERISVLSTGFMAFSLQKVH